jgi:RNA polymerase subunit RPABC4/transcription elongation factor Spt4
MERDSDRSKVMHEDIQQRLFFERENQCPLCGNDLEIKAKSHGNVFVVDEEAYCRHCDMVTRSKSHKLN